MRAGTQAGRRSPLRIAFVIATLDQAGAEKQLTLLATNLPRDEFEPHVLALHRGGHYEAVLREAGIPVHVIGKRRKLDLGTFRRLRAALRAIDPDVIHSWMFTANAHVRLLHDGRRQRPWILTSERGHDDLKTRWQRWLDRRLVARTSGIVVNARALADSARAAGFAAERITIIPNGIEPTPPRSRLTGREPDDDFRIAFVGRLSPEKRVDVLIEAARQLVEAGLAVKLDLMGDGPERPALEHSRARAALGSRISFRGHQPDASSLLPAYDAFWLASDFEGTSNSLLEAMAAGLAVVVSAIPANSGVVRAGETGLLFTAGDPAALAAATRRLIDDPKLAARLGCQAAASIESSYVLESMIVRHAALFRSLVDGRDRRV